MSFNYFAINKPYGYLSQFTGETNDLLLGQLYNFPKDVYPVGRLDKDSEGLLILTNDNRLKTSLLDPKSNHTKTYLVQVEGEIDQNAIDLLSAGTIVINHNGKKHQVSKAECKKVFPKNISERTPSIRYRANIPTSWIEISITEGKNRQVRKMTAATGFPTLRLIRIKIGQFELGELPAGSVKTMTQEEVKLLLK